MWGVVSAGLTPPLMSCGDLGGLPKVSEPQAPHLRNWGTVRSVVTIQCTLTYNHSEQHLALGPMSLARWPQLLQGLEGQVCICSCSHFLMQMAFLPYDFKGF